jgi:hypothetical protein
MRDICMYLHMHTRTEYYGLQNRPSNLNLIDPNHMLLNSAHTQCHLKYANLQPSVLQHLMNVTRADPSI